MKNKGYRFLKPKYPGQIIRDPISRTPLSKDGELKPWVGREGTYWRRRVLEGSCVIGQKPKQEDNKKGGK